MNFTPCATKFPRRESVPLSPAISTHLDGVGLGFGNRAVFSTMERREQYDLFCNGQASCDGLLEPYFAVRKRPSMTAASWWRSDFSSSLTQNRRALYAGEIAMLPEQLTMFSLYEDEQPACEIDFFGYPIRYSRGAVDADVAGAQYGVVEIIHGGS